MMVMQVCSEQRSVAELICLTVDTTDIPARPHAILHCCPTDMLNVEKQAPTRHTAKVYSVCLSRLTRLNDSTHR
jgi:hypothetical protein